MRRQGNVGDELLLPCGGWTRTYRFRTPRALWEEAALERVRSRNPVPRRARGHRSCKDELDLGVKVGFGARRSEIIASAEALGGKPLSVVAGNSAILP